MKQPENLCQLLPWYVNGTLDAEGMRHMEEHFDDCKDCADDFETAMQFSRCLQKPPEGIQELQSMKNFGFSQLQNKIKQQDIALNKESKSVATGWRQTIQQLWNSYQWFFSAASGATVMLLAILVVPNTGSQGINEDFELLSNDTYANYPIVQVMFEPSATEQQMRGFMIMHKLELLGSPSASGIYRFKLASDLDTDEKTQEIMSLTHVLWASLE